MKTPGSKKSSSKKYQGYHSHNIILQITISGLLVALAILIGIYGNFKIGGGGVYLLASIVFLFPLLLKFPYILLSTMSSCIMTDWLTGWIAFSWITLIAYTGAVTIIWLFQLTKFKIAYFLGVFLGSVFLVMTYLLLEMTVFDVSIALKDAISTTIQMLICIPILWILYFPIKAVSKTIKI